jgi:hypothetical protein
MGSLYFASLGYASPLTHHGMRIYLHTGLQACTSHHQLAELPSCVTPSFDYYRLRPHAPHTTTPKGTSMVRVVSITDLARDASTRVREYQPVIHRLRLSASP